MYFKNRLPIYTIILYSLFLFACKNNSFFYDIKFQAINIPIVKLEMTPVLDLDSIPKHDSKSLMPSSLRKGVEHEIVTSIQDRLMKLGFMDIDKPTSYYGESTETAIKKFQRQIGFKQDGICSLEVYEKLMANDAITYEIKRGYSGDDIKIVQQQLYELSYLLYEDDVNGYYGLKTETAVTKMQKSNDLKPTGKVDLNTLNMLYNENVKSFTINKAATPDIIIIYQNRLKELGYYFGPIDGIYTEDFRNAVRTYQVNNSQIADGYISPSTKFSLDSKYARPFSLFLEQKGTSVKNMQKRLVELGYLEPRRATGYYGEFTAQAVALFQRENGLEMTGAVDGITNSKLNDENALPSPTGPIKFLKEFVMDIIDIKKHIKDKENIGNVEDLLKVAMLKLGSKYVWGSRGPNTFDCSGFVFWCLNQVGVNVSYMTTYNWRFSTQFEKVEKFEDLIVGDLIIINGHMGIVSENETVIDASSSNGKVVHRELDDWWRERFIVGFRIFQENKEDENGTHTDLR